MEITIANDYMNADKTITDFTNPYKTCSGCGNCCANMLPLTEKEIRVIQDYVKKHHITPHKVCFPLKDPMIDITCPFLDNNKKKDKCKIYQVRPSICRYFICSGQKDIMDNAMKDPVTDKRTVIDMKHTFFPDTK